MDIEFLLIIIAYKLRHFWTPEKILRSLGGDGATSTTAECSVEEVVVGVLIICYFAVVYSRMNYNNSYKYSYSAKLTKLL